MQTVKPKKSRAKPKPLEGKLQMSCVEWFDLQFPSYLLFAIPNGGKRSAKTGYWMKQEGVRSGIPDLFLAFAVNEYHGLFIELKVGKGKLTDKQKEKCFHLHQSGYAVSVCRTFQEFMQVIKTYIKEGKVLHGFNARD